MHIQTLMISENEKCSKEKSTENWKLRGLVANDNFYENVDTEVKYLRLEFEKSSIYKI